MIKEKIQEHFPKQKKTFPNLKDPMNSPEEWMKINL